MCTQKIIHSPQKELTLFEAVMEVHTNHGRDISRGVKSRQKSGRDRDGLPDFLTNRDRDQDGYHEFRDEKLGKVRFSLNFSRHF